jgi:AcrR family transcriptional regulator
MPVDKNRNKNRIFMFQALVELIRDKPFESIAVQEIIEKAMVSRVTFYRHISNKEQLLSFGVSYFANEAIDSMGVLRCWNLESIRNVVDTFFAYLDKWEKWLLPLMGPNAPESVKRQFSMIIDDYLQNSVFYDMEGVKYPVSRQFLVSMTRNIIMTFILKWPSMSSAQKEQRINCFYGFIVHGMNGLVSLLSSGETILNFTECLPR